MKEGWKEKGMGGGGESARVGMRKKGVQERRRGREKEYLPVMQRRRNEWRLEQIRVTGRKRRMEEQNRGEKSVIRKDGGKERWM